MKNDIAINSASAEENAISNFILIFNVFIIGQPNK